MFNDLKYTRNILVYFGILLISLNFVFHAIGDVPLISPLGFSSVMTIFTSISLLVIFLGFLSSNKKIKHIYSFVALLSQIVSLILLKYGQAPTWIYLENSSVPTSFSIFLIVIFTSLTTLNLKGNLKLYLGPILFILNLFFLYSFIVDQLYFLGIAKDRPGVGLSPYTLASFFLISSIVTLKNTKVISLNALKIKFQPILIFFTLVMYSVLFFLLLYCPKENIFFIAIVLNLSFLILTGLLLIKPFLKLDKNYLTICAWSKNIKTIDENWISQEELLKSLGIDVSHGISPNELSKLKNKNKL